MKQTIDLLRTIHRELSEYSEHGKCYVRIEYNGEYANGEFIAIRVDWPKLDLKFKQNFSVEQMSLDNMPEFLVDKFIRFAKSRLFHKAELNQHEQQRQQPI